MDLIIKMPATDSASAVIGINYADEQIPRTRVHQNKKLVMVNTQLELSEIEARYPVRWETVIAQGEQSQEYKFKSKKIGNYPRVAKTEPLVDLMEFAADLPDGSRPTISQLIDVLGFKFQGHEYMQNVKTWTVQTICDLDSDDDAFEPDGKPKLDKVRGRSGDKVGQKDLDDAWDKIKLKLEE